jgi:hypothetical protein
MQWTRNPTTRDHNKHVPTCLRTKQHGVRTTTGSIKNQTLKKKMEQISAYNKYS